MQSDMRERLIEIIEQSGMLEGKIRSGIVADHLIANGAVLPPCKVRDTVYYLDGKTIVKAVVHCISFGGRHGVNAKGFIHMHDSNKDNVTVNFSLFGDKVFLTKDQAEQKLKEMIGNNAK